MTDNNFLPMPRFLALLLLMCNETTVKDFRPLGGGRRKEARPDTPCMTQFVSPSRTSSGSSCLLTWKYMDVTLTSGKKVSLLKSTAHPALVGHVEPVREKLVVNILNHFLK